MRRLCLLLTLLTPIVVAAMQPGGVITGRVTDQATGEGLPGANIIHKKDAGTVTDSQGYYHLRLPDGNATLSYLYTGYQSVTRNITVTGDTLVINIGLVTEVSELDQVVVSASRIEQRLSELTVSMSLIKPGFLSSRHITDAQEAINKTAGIEVLDGQASIRGGSGFSYGAGSRVLALLDGLPVMAADAGNVRWQFLPLDNISQVEIIKGASSVVYGSSAVNGIINFRTADATETPQTRFYVETGVFDQPSNPHWKWWDSPRTFSSGSVFHLRRIGQTDLGGSIHLMNDNGYRLRNHEKLGRMNLKFKQRNSNIQGLSYGFNVNAGITNKYDFILWDNAETGGLIHDESTAIELNSHFIAFDPYITYRIDEQFKHELKARVQSSQNQFPASAQNDSHAMNVYAEYQFWNKLSEMFTLNTGFTGNNSRIESKFYGDHRSLNLGMFAQLDLEPVNRLKISSGVRMEYNSLDGEDTQPVPLFRAGLNYKLHELTYLRGSYGQGYRYPSIAEKYASTTLGAVKIFPAPNIEAERGWNSEIGIKQGIMSRYFNGQLDLAFFYSQNKNMIEFLFGNYPDPVTDEYSLGFKAHNVEASRVYGFELEYVINKTIGKVTNTLNGGYVFMYPVEFNTYTGKNTNTMLKYRRKHSATFNLLSTYRKLDLGVSLFLKSKILNIDDVFLNPLTRETILPGFYDYWTKNNKGYYLIDVQAGIPFANSYRVSFVVKNLTNTEYMGRPGDVQPHRNFSIRISGNF